MADRIRSASPENLVPCKQFQRAASMSLSALHDEPRLSIPDVRSEVAVYAHNLYLIIVVKPVPNVHGSRER